MNIETGCVCFSFGDWRGEVLALLQIIERSRRGSCRFLRLDRTAKFIAAHGLVAVTKIDACCTLVPRQGGDLIHVSGGLRRASFYLCTEPME